MRRVHVSQLAVGELELDKTQSHHARNVLRLTLDERVEAFDDTGLSADAQIIALEPRVVVRVDAIRQTEIVTHLTIASAVPKGERADWMIEKLSELGCARFIPLAAARSVVLPEGKNKRERWMRIAIESAKQSRRAGVMQIDELTKPDDLATNGTTLFLSTQTEAQPLASFSAARELTLLIGPEGGWTDDELTSFSRRGYAAGRLTDTILRIETAAIAAATVVLCSSNRGGAT